MMNALVIPVAAASALSAAILLPVGAFEDMLIIPMFEGVVLLSSVFALLTAVGRFPRGPGLSLLCCGGAIASLALLAEPTLVSRLFGASGRPLVIAGVKMAPLMYARIGVGVFLVATAAMIVWARRAERSVGYLIRSVLAFAPALIVLLLTPIPKPSFLAPLDRVTDAIASAPLVVGLVLTVVAFFLVLGLVSAGGHCLIRSFEVGRLDDEAGSENNAGGAGAAPARASAAGT